VFDQFVAANSEAVFLAENKECLGALDPCEEFLLLQLTLILFNHALVLENLYDLLFIEVLQVFFTLSLFLSEVERGKLWQLVILLDLIGAHID
jgi:hypothetical protein